MRWGGEGSSLVYFLLVVRFFRILYFYFIFFSLVLRFVRFFLLSFKVFRMCRFLLFFLFFASPIVRKLSCFILKILPAYTMMFVCVNYSCFFPFHFHLILNGVWNEGPVCLFEKIFLCDSDFFWFLFIHSPSLDFKIIHLSPRSNENDFKRFLLWFPKRGAATIVIGRHIV